MTAPPPTAAPPAHHLPDEALLEYVSGTSTHATALATACHLALCPVCAARAASQEAVAGALLASGPAAALPAGMLDRVLARLDDAPAPGGDDPAPPPVAPELAGLGLPRPLLRA